MKIDCGVGYIYNPLTGKCVKEDGDAATRLREQGTVSRVGECNGVVKRSATGVSHCTRAKKPVKPKKKAPPANTAIVMDPVAARALAEHTRRRAGQNAADSLRLKLVESQMQRQLKKTNALMQSLVAIKSEIRQLGQRVARPGFAPPQPGPSQSEPRQRR